MARTANKTRIGCRAARQPPDALVLLVLATLRNVEVSQLVHAAHGSEKLGHCRMGSCVKHARRRMHTGGISAQMRRESSAKVGNNMQ